MADQGQVKISTTVVEAPVSSNFVKKKIKGEHHPSLLRPAEKDES